MKPDFAKGNGLIPVIIQHIRTSQVLMLGYMNEVAFEKTKAEGKVTFYSRSKKRLWTKGKVSGNYLMVEEIHLDCDADTFLIKVTPHGATCHTGATSCFKEETSKGFVYELEATIHQRVNEGIESSYTNKLYQRGINKVAQKVGEEAVELVIEAKDNNDHLFVNEAADLMFHFLLLLKAKNMSFQDVENCLKQRSK